MSWEPSSEQFVTDGRLELARHCASDIADREPWSNGYACAEKAVRRVFGRWLLDATATVRPQYLGLYYRLIGQVESQLGLHRRTEPVRGPAPSGHAQKVPDNFAFRQTGAETGLREAC